MKTEQDRLDLFAAHALQGLLATGQYVYREKSKFGDFVDFELTRPIDDNDDMPTYKTVVNLAWSVANSMVADEGLFQNSAKPRTRRAL